MRQNVPWSLEGVDPDTRDAARDAARRAGMSLEDWINAAISDRAAKVLAEQAPAQRRRAPQPNPNDELDAVAAKLNKVTRGRTQPAPRAPDEVMTSASAEMDRRARENAAKTAVALDSVARWIERAEDRISETSRVAHERQDRTTAVLGEALGLMTRRLDEIDRKIVEGQQPSTMAALKAVEKVEQQLAKIGENERSQAHNNQIETALRGFEERIGAITERLAANAGPRPPGRRGLSVRDEIKGAVAEIRSRQGDLDGPAAGDPAKRNHADVLAALREDVARLAGQIEAGRAGGKAQESSAAAVRQEIARLHEALAGLATRDEVAGLERALRDLTRHAASGAGGVDLDAVARTIDSLQGEVHRLSDAVAAGVHGRIAADLDNLSRKVDTLAGSGAGRHESQALAREIGELRALLSEMADPDRVQGLSEQVAELSRQVGAIGRSQVDAREFASLKSAVEDIRTAVKQSRPGDVNAAQMLNQFEALSQRLDELGDRLPQIDGDALTRQYAALTDHMAELAAAQPRREIERLGAQIDGLTLKLDAVAGHVSHADAAAVADQIAALSRQVSAMSNRPQPHVDLRSLDGQFEALTARLDELAARPAAPDLSPFARQLDALERKLDAASSLAAPTVSTDHLTARLDALATKLDRLGDEPNRAIEREFERLQRSMDDALAASQTSVPPYLDSLVERLDRLDATLARPAPSQELKPLEELLRQLTSKIEAAERPNAGIDSLDALENQIAALSERLERGADPSLSTLERTMGDLMGRIETMRDGTLEAAERAAKLAIADTLGSLPKTESGHDGIHLGAISRDMADLKALQDSAERRSRDTLEAVHETLEKLVARLASLEQEPARGPSRRSKDPRPALGETKRAGADEGILDKDTVQQLEAAARAHLAAAGPGERVPGSGSLDDVLLEPGSGRPRVGTGRTDTSRAAAAGEGDASDIKASFIAAARRAAQAAAAEAAAAASKGRSARAEIDASNTSAGGPKGLATRIAQVIERPRRPLLLGLAAIVLAMAAVQVGQRLSGSDETRIAQPIALEKLPEPSPSLPSAPGPTGARGPSTTEAIAAVPAMRMPSLLAQAQQNAGERSLEPSAESLAVIPSEDIITAPRIAGSTHLQEQLQRAVETANAAAARTAARSADEYATRAPQENAARLGRVASMAAFADVPVNAGPPALRQAMLDGDPVAIYEFAARAAEGRGMMRDLKLAARLFERVAAHGLVPAQYRIGNHYEKGLGVTRDLALAKVWYQRAAEKGNARAMHNLAVLLAEGAGGKPDYAAATGWFRRAAEHGIRDSQYNLAVLLARGLGSAQDLQASHVWFDIAASQGDEDAGKKRDEVGARLSPSEREAAKGAARRWRPEIPDPATNEVALPAQGWNDPAGREGSRASGA